MENKFQLLLEQAEPNPGDMATLIQGLTDFNAQHTGGAVAQHLFATVRDSEGVLAGGLLGGTYVGWIHIQVVWLADHLRGQGYGRAMMQLAEREAVRRGCTNAFVETFDFQALPFYEKCGYTVFSRLPDFPPGGARYSLTKRLALPADI